MSKKTDKVDLREKKIPARTIRLGKKPQKPKPAEKAKEREKVAEPETLKIIDTKKLDPSDYIFRPKRDRVSKLDTSQTKPFHSKDEGKAFLSRDIDRMAELQDVLYAESKHAVLIVFQAMDAAGKDSTIKHVMGGINPQGCQVYSFKQPSTEELDHDYLWRSAKALPERGRIGIFNRSYYEEMLVVRVHPSILQAQQLPEHVDTKNIFKDRFRQVNAFERYLTENGITILKFFLNVSRKEQKERFLARLDDPNKNWKFSASDVKERSYWDDYMAAYQDMLTETSTSYAPWHVIPADNKWFTRTVVARTIVEKLESLDLEYPKLTKEQSAALLEARSLILAEKG